MMKNLEKKIDFVLFLTVVKANPNGDPLDGNRPRIDYDGYGEISDVCIKRKIRNRMQDMGKEIFVKMAERSDDDCYSLQDRFDKVEELKKEKDINKITETVNKTWLDVRAFGQVFAFKNKKDSKSGVSIGVRGPVSIHSAVSIEPVDVTSMQITKSVNSETQKDPNKKDSSTMGMKHRVEFGTYRLVGSINPQLAEKTGFSEEDAEIVKKCLATLFENDESSARPSGSIEVNALYWFKHKTKAGDYSSAQIHRSIQLEVQDESKNNFGRYKVVENIPEGFSRKEEGNVILLEG